MQSDSFCEKLLSLGICAIGEILESALEHVPVTESACKALDLIGNLVHPNIEERLSVLHDLLLQKLGKRHDLCCLFVVHEILERLKVSHAALSGDLPLWALSHFRQIMNAFLSVRKDVFDDLLHEDAIITFCCHA